MSVADRAAGFRWLMPPALLIGVTILVFGQCATFGWTNWDDQIHVTENPNFQPTAFSHLVDFWREPYGRLYIPLSYMFFAVEVWFARLLSVADHSALPPAGVFHLTSIALHVGCVLLAWRLLTALVAKPWPATIGAVLFAIHPLQVESVAWISEQRGLLAGLFSLAALNWHLLAVRTDPGRERGLSCAAFGAFLAAILSKPSAITLPLLAGAIDVLMLGRPWRRVATDLAPWFAVALIAAIGTKILQPDAIVVDRPVFWLRPLIAGDALASYAAKLILPFHLGMDYGRTPAFVGQDFRAWATAVIAYAVLALPFVLPALRTWRPPIVLAVATLLPVLGFVPFSFQHVSTVADRYMYVAMLGPALAASLLAEKAGRFPRWNMIVKAVIACVVAALAVTSFMQARTWRNCETLYGHAMRINPTSHHARNNLGTALLDAGQPGRAVEHLRAAIALKPDFAKARYNLATTLHRLGRHQEALEHYESTLRLDSLHADAHNNLGILLAQQGLLREAIHHFEAAVAIRPDFPDARRNLRQAFEHLGDGVESGRGEKMRPPAPSAD